MSATEFLFLGAATAADFVNTWTRDRGQDVERLGDFAALLRWVRAAKLMTVADREAALGRWPAHADADEVLRRAHALRDAIREHLESAEGTEPLRRLVNAYLGAPAPRARIVPARKTGALMWATYLGDAGPEALLRMLAIAAGDLLCVPREHLAHCQSPDCVVWFVASGETAHRAWCDDARCGRRNRTARWKAKKQADGTFHSSYQGTPKRFRAEKKRLKQQRKP